MTGLPSEPKEVKIARAICAERCAFMGEPACWRMRDDQDKPLPWPAPNCDDPGCMALAMAAAAALPHPAGREEALEEARPFKWAEDYGKDLLVDLNQLAHARGTDATFRDALQRAFKEITRLRRALKSHAWEKP